MENVSAVEVGCSEFEEHVNDTQNVTLDSELRSLFVAQTHIRYAVVVCYLVTFVFGMVGNTLVIYIIGHFTSERLKSVANYYIWSLAFADLTFVTSLPIFGWATLVEAWPLSGVIGSISCKMAYACRDITKFASAWTMVALSVDRCLASSYNTRSVRTIRCGKIVIVVIWSFCFAISTHNFVYAQTLKGKCYLFMSPTYEYIWTTMHVLMGYILPSVGIYTSYCVLWRRIRMRTITRQNSNTSLSRSNRSMTRTVLVVVVTFTLCQTPYHVMQMVRLVPRNHRDVTVSYSHIKLIVYVNAVSQILVFVASCCNPIIYGLMNCNFRRLYITTFCLSCNRNRSQIRRSSSVSTNVNMDNERNQHRLTNANRLLLGDSHSPMPTATGCDTQMTVIGQETASFNQLTNIENEIEQFLSNRLSTPV